MSDNELNANQQNAVPTRPLMKYPWNSKWNSNRVEARLNRENYIQLGHFMKDKGYQRMSEALKEILTDYLKNYPTSN